MRVRKQVYAAAGAIFSHIHGNNKASSGMRPPPAVGVESPGTSGESYTIIKQTTGRCNIIFPAVSYRHTSKEICASIRNATLKRHVCLELCAWVKILD